MKSNKLTIKINKPLSEVFGFLLSPANSPLWVDSFVKEETSDWPVKMGTIYKNLSKDGLWREYTVTAFKENEVFELTSADKNYHVLYTFRPFNDNITELEYYEWVDKGELDEPFKIETLQKLKSIIENGY